MDTSSILHLDICIIDCHIGESPCPFRKSQKFQVRAVRVLEDATEKVCCKTRTCVSRDLKPSWNEHFVYGKSSGKALKFQVWNPHRIADIFCGEGELYESALFEHALQNSDHVHDLPLYNRQKRNGSIRFTAVPTGTPDDTKSLSPLVVQERVQALLNRPDDIEQFVRKKFRELARPASGFSHPVLSFEQVTQLANLYADKLQVSPDVFGDVGQMCYRFDFVGRGYLDEEECLKMTLLLLQQYRDSLLPQDTTIKLGEDIQYVKLTDKYEILKKLGEGGQGSVYLAQDKAGSREVVVKTYDKSNPNSPLEDIEQEFGLLTKLKHPRIARVFDILQDSSNVYIIQEPYFGGDLTTAVEKACDAGLEITEGWMAGIFHQIMAGVEFLHANYVIHADLKEANVMVTGESDWDAPQVVVIDFGLASKFNASSTPGGTPGYIPPEVWKFGLWTPRGDVFSLGVMLFSMVEGDNPFTHGAHTMHGVKKRTCKKNPTLQYGSHSFKTLVYAMIQKSLADRPTVARLIEDPWFSRSQAGSAPVDMRALRNMTCRRQQSDLYRALLADKASKECLSQLKDLNQLFVKLDTDNDGLVTAEEMRSALHGRWKDSDIKALITNITGGQEGPVSYEEFMGQLMAACAPEENQLLEKLFDDADTDGSGHLTVANIQDLLRRPAVARVLGARAPEELAREMDVDEDGTVSFEEFKRAMQRGTHTDCLYKQGEAVEYLSPSHDEWLPCTVTTVDTRTGAVQISVRPDVWIRGAQLKMVLRKCGLNRASSPSW